MTKLPAFVGAVVSGVVSLGVLSGMLVIHAWPLWTGTPIYLKVRPVDPRDLFRGDYVTLGYDVTTLRLNVPAEFRPPTPVNPAPGAIERPMFPEVAPVGEWWRPGVSGGWSAAQLRRTLYVQLRPEPSDVPGVPAIHVPVSLSDHPVDGAINLAGRMTMLSDYTYQMDYGIDALYVREGTGRPLESAISGSGTPVYAEVFVTGSGRARVRSLVVNGERTP